MRIRFDGAACFVDCDVGNGNNNHSESLPPRLAQIAICKKA